MAKTSFYHVHVATSLHSKFLLYFAYFQLAEQYVPVLLPPSRSKKKAEDDAFAPGAMTGQDFSLILRNIDGAQPDFDDG
jgi:hypothetical protein